MKEKTNLFFFILFSDGRCLLELSHRDSSSGIGDSSSSSAAAASSSDSRSESGHCWIPITKKVYWPPAGGPASAATAVIAKVESPAGTLSGKFKKKIARQIPQESQKYICCRFLPARSSQEICHKYTESRRDIVFLFPSLCYCL